LLLLRIMCRTIKNPIEAQKRPFNRDLDICLYKKISQKEKLG
jgi:hypothetical protein